MKVLPQALQNLIDAFGTLPGVGPRTAERYAYYLLRANPDKATNLSEALSALHANITSCPKTFALIEKGKQYSDLYTDPGRDKQVVAVVAEPFDIVALEKTGQYKGTYHVLGGLVSPIDNIGPDQLHIRELIQRIDDDKVKEVILATNASVEGESTALYIQQEIGDRDVKLTRLARGLPIGIDLEYADQITLTRALEGRQTI
ncbi:recombination protein RecR [Candidatus Saccharibacteria bacterium]|nr:recombination protein RecR [Candidatus Saccharibacteria bacterium]MCA9337574.1 recombination protein RecR [Candidatus Saccharibacteria bacterium]